MNDAIQAMEEEGIDGLMERLEFMYQYGYNCGHRDGFMVCGGDNDAYDHRDD